MLPAGQPGAAGQEIDQRTLVLFRALRESGRRLAHQKVAKKPVQWRLMVTVGQPTDTTNPTLLWPSDRQQIDAGTVSLDHLASENGGPCINVNYDPTVLPSGIEPSDDPLLSTRSATYSRSFTLRENERSEKPPSAVTPQEVAAGGKS